MPVRDVLVVDDSKTESLFLARLLQGHGFSVRTAAPTTPCPAWPASGPI
jgi:CheY-like chemotaxis protein